MKAVRYSLALLCFAAGVACVVFCAYGLWTLRSAWSPESALVLAGFAALAGLLFAAGARALRRRDVARDRELALGLLVAAATTIVTLLIAEFVLARLRPAVTYDEARRRSPAIYRSSSILPFELRPGYRGATYSWEAGKSVDLTINRHGYRSPEFDLAKPPGTYRILVLGDSFAINLNVSDADLYTTLLARRLTNEQSVRCRVEVVNAGFADGYSPDAYVAYLLQKGVALQPDLVIAQYFVLNDFKDLLENEIQETRDGMPVRIRSKSKFIDDDGRLRNRWLWKTRLPVLRNSHLFNHLWRLTKMQQVNQTVVRVLHPTFGEWDGIPPEVLYGEAEARSALLQRAFEQSLEHVRSLHRETERRGADFLLYLVPSGAQTSKAVWATAIGTPPPANWDRPDPQAQIADALAPDGITVIDPLERYREGVARETLYLGSDQNGHWNEAGNAWTARILFDLLTQDFDPFRRDCLQLPDRSVAR